MKKLLVAAVSFAMGLTAFSATLEQVIVRQLWPWSTDILVEYKLSGVTAAVDIGVKAYDGATELTLPESAISGDRYGITQGGVGQLTIDPVAAFGTGRIALSDFKVKLTVTDSAANVNEVIYKIFDLATGACEDVKRSDFYNHPEKFGTFETDYAKCGNNFSTPETDLLIWTGVTNDIAYKTTKLVMRKIPAKNRVWTMGGSDEIRAIRTGGFETNHFVRLSYDYWIGVFELTRKQVEMIGGSHAMTSSATDADLLPERKFSYFESSAKASVAYYVQLLKNRTGVTFAAPNEAEWEFAANANASAYLYSGKTPTSGFWATGDYSAFNELAWSFNNAGNAVHAVGQKAPNAFGLYDVLGNVFEYTCNRVEDTVEEYYASFGDGWTPETIVEDPTGTSIGGKVTLRGGGCATYGAMLRAGFRHGNVTAWEAWNLSGSEGLRVMMK